MKEKQKILDKVPIETEIGKYVDLKKRGVNYIGLCPFHSEKTPSFVVSPAKKIYKCFGCGKSGNIISFIQDFKKVSFDDAIQILSYDYQIEPEKDYEPTRKSEKYSKNSIESKVFNTIRDNFHSNVKSVRELMNFDNIILDYCIQQIEYLDERIKNNEELKITSVVFFPQNTLKQLRQIKKNNSFRNMYESMFNQSLVLLVSYFTTAIKELFRAAIQYFVENNNNHFESIKSDLKFSFQELCKYNFNLSSEIGSLIIGKKNISFQDMQSIIRVFKLYFGVEISKNSDIDNIIFSQASRHTIVHALSIADEKFINQIRNANKRTIKPHIKINEEIVFSTDEIEQVMESMDSFLMMLFEKIKKQITTANNV